VLGYTLYRNVIPYPTGAAAWFPVVSGGWLVAAILLFAVMGSARGVGGIAMNTNLMEMVPPHLMGRVQNTFYFFGTFLQLVLALAVGAVAHRVSLVAAFAILACVYGLSFVAASWPVGTSAAVEEVGAAK